MTMTTDTWRARATMCELLSLSFRYPEDLVLANAVVSGEWNEAADELANALGITWNASAKDNAVATTTNDPAELQDELRRDATRLFVGSPDPLVSPYEGIWRAKDDGVQPLLFVNPHSMDVERFCKACGLGHAEGTNVPLDSVWTELELLEYLALRAAADLADAEGIVVNEAPMEDVVSSEDLPGGSPEAAWDQFMNEHVRVWIPRFAESVQKEARTTFYKQAADLLLAFVE